jgi:hypothetical protein
MLAIKYQKVFAWFAAQGVCRGENRFGKRDKIQIF